MLINKRTASQQSQALVGKVLKKMEGLNKARKNFIVSTLVLYLALRGRYTFLGLSRYGSYSEKTFHTQFAKEFDWLGFNWELIKDHISPNRMLVFDPSYIPKSGKQTPHLGNFWSGCLGKALKGLEIGVLGVVDLDKHSAFHLRSTQTLGPSELQEQGLSLVDFYLGNIISEAERLEQIADTITLDGYFAKEDFINGIKEHTNLEVLTKLRKDADLRYLYEGEYSGKGRPKLYDGKVDLKNIDKIRFKKVTENEDAIVYECICNVVNLKRNGKVIYVQYKKAGELSDRYSVYFSTNTKIEGTILWHNYKARFQIEFLIRDGKQHTGLTHCQSRNVKKLDFHFNTSLSAINLAKIRHDPKMESKEQYSFSMADVKSLYFNELMLDFFFSNFQVQTDLKENMDKIEKVLNFGTIAA